MKYYSTHNGSVYSSTDYFGPFVYKNGVLSYVLTVDGRAIFSSGNFSYFEYHLKDHLGNVRVTFKKNSSYNIPVVLQKTDYYPFGMIMWSSGSTSNRYLFNGKEKIDEALVETNWYDYGARMYDPTIARWHVNDPMSSSRYNVSGYGYCQNNPVNRIDIMGMVDHEYTYNISATADVALQKISEEGGDADYTVKIVDDEGINYRTAHIKGDRIDVTNIDGKVVEVSGNIVGVEGNENSTASNNQLQTFDISGEGIESKTDNGTGAISIGISGGYAFQDHSYGAGMGYFFGSNSRGIYFTKKSGNGVLFSISGDFTYYQSLNQNSVELQNIYGNGYELEFGAFDLGYSLSNNGQLYDDHIYIPKTYNAHTISLSDGMHIGCRLENRNICDTIIPDN